MKDEAPGLEGESGEREPRASTLLGPSPSKIGLRAQPRRGLVIRPLDKNKNYFLTFAT